MTTSENSGSCEKLRDITIALHEPIREFVRTNAIPLSKAQRTAGFYIDPLQISDVSPFTMEGCIRLSFDNGSQGFTLPVGRSLSVAQVAGVIQDFTMYVFERPTSFAEAQRFLKDFIAELDGKDWRVQGAVDIPRAPSDLGTTQPWSIVAQLEDRRGDTAEVKLADYGLAPRQESWITVPLGRSAEPSHSFLVQVSVLAPGYTRYGDAIYPRRLYVNGSKTAALPLRAWIDDPDWSPAAHGMVAIPEAERHGDMSFWRMPH